ncbi:MAG: hydrogenase maturation nickel metallochaperone HypA [Syntrophales bacterium]
MHELPVMQSILAIVLKHAAMHNVKKVHAINLLVGKLSDLEAEWMQRYFDYLSAGTVVAGAKLNIEWVPAVLSCEVCQTRVEINKVNLDGITCPACAKNKFQLVSGKEYHIKNMEAE